MNRSPEDPYTLFLNTADATTWRECMDRAAARVPVAPADAEGFDELAKAL